MTKPERSTAAKESRPEARLTDYFRENIRDYRFSRWKIVLLSVAGLMVAVGGMLRMAGAPEPTSETSVASDADGSRPTEREAERDRERLTVDGGTGSDRASSLKPGDVSSILPGIDIRIDPPTIPPTTPPSTPGELPDGDSTPAPTPRSDDGAEDTASSGGGASDPVSWALLKGGFGFFVGFCVGFAARTLLRFSALVVGGYFLTLIALSGLGWIEVRWDTMREQFDHFVTVWGPELESFESFLAGKIPLAGATVAGLYAGLRRR